MTKVWDIMSIMFMILAELIVIPFLKSKIKNNNCDTFCELFVNGLTIDHVLIKCIDKPVETHNWMK